MTGGKLGRFTVIHCSFGGPTVVLGRWRVELHPQCGPVLLNKRGDPLERQPGERDPFWRTWEAWCAAGRPLTTNSKGEREWMPQPR